MTTRVAVWPSGTCVVWKAITWGEYRRIRALPEPPAVKAMAVYSFCRVEGPQPNEVIAGIMMWISQYELENSPFAGSFTALSLPLEQARAKVANTYLLSAQAFIASVLKVPFDKMEEWDADTLLIRLAQAELIAGVPLNVVDPSTNQTSKMAKSDTTIRKKPLTSNQQTALARRNENDRTNIKSPRTINTIPQR
jgi:hypothetical protein